MSTSARPQVDQGFLRRMAQATAQAAIDRTPVPTLRPATVVASTEGIVSLVLDGDDSPVLAEALVPEPEAEDRVMVLLQPPSGAFVVGYVGASRERWGSGGGGATEVVVDPSAPAEREELLLWVDTDATPLAGTWQALALSAPYSPYVGWQTPQWRQLGDVVEVRGLCHCNGATVGSTIAMVPGPTVGLIFVGCSDSSVATSRIDVMPDGRLVLSGPAPLDYLSLANVRYSVA